MTMKRNPIFLSLLFALLGMAALAGCAVTPQTRASSQDIVRERAAARWNALIAGDVDAAYRFLQPAYRAVRDLNFYKRTVSSGAVQWKRVDVIDVGCEGEICTVQLRIDYTTNVMKGVDGILSNHFDERWVRDEGDWWLYQKP